jgi:hypothetical protein
MKKLFLVLIFAPSLSFGQTPDEYFNKANDKAELQDYRALNSNQKTSKEVFWFEFQIK